MNHSGPTWLNIQLQPLKDMHVRLEVGDFSEPFPTSTLLSMQAAKAALGSLGICLDSPEPSLPHNVISTKISRANGSFISFCVKKAGI